MAWQDRHYYRDSGAPTWSPLHWLMYGSVPLFTAFGIRVRAHAMLILCIVIMLIFGVGEGFNWQDKFEASTMLFAIVLLHEFGHCFAARWVGGDADQIVMHPLGGLALASPPRRPLPTFITVAAGPAVNVLICLITGAILRLTTRSLSLNPLHFSAPSQYTAWHTLLHYDYWIYSMSYVLLVFNLIPVYPLDGGQMVQAIAWPKLGYYRSMMFSCVFGMVAAVLVGMAAIALLNLNLGLLAGFGFIASFTMRRYLLASGPEEFSDTTDYSAAYEQPTIPRRRRRINRRAVKRARKREMQWAQEQQRIDKILAKVSSQGMQSLTWMERRALHKATEHKRKADLETAMKKSVSAAPQGREPAPAGRR